ncbi:MAG: neutral zinc metallopeptidase [Chloroflexota bacterium]
MKHHAARVSLAAALLLSLLVTLAGPPAPAVAATTSPEATLVTLAELPPGFAPVEEGAVAPLLPDGIARQAAASFRREALSEPGVSAVRQVVLVFDDRSADEYLPRFRDLMVRRQGYTQVAASDTEFRLTRTQGEETSAVMGQARGETLILTTVTGTAGAVSPDDAASLTRIAVARVPVVAQSAPALASDPSGNSLARAQSGSLPSRTQPGRGHLNIPNQQDAARWPQPVRNLPGPPEMDVVQVRGDLPPGDPAIDAQMPTVGPQPNRVQLPDTATDLARFTIGLAPILDNFWRHAVFMTDVKYESPSMVVVPAGHWQEAGCPISPTQMIAANNLFYCVTDGTIYAYEPFLLGDMLAGSEWHSRDFVIAAAVAHEWGHHIQTLTGMHAYSVIYTDNQPDNAPIISRQMELQADCYAGLFTRYARDHNWLNPGDLNEAVEGMIRAGDDHIESAGHHGLPAERKEWFMRGYTHYAFSVCDPY